MLLNYLNKNITNKEVKKMGTISKKYKIMPDPLDVLKENLGLEVIDHNITFEKGDIVNNVELTRYVVYAACKYKDEILAFIGLIDYDPINKQVYCKIMDETVGPFYYDMKKSVFDKLTDIKTYPYAIDWRSKVSQNFNKTR